MAAASEAADGVSNLPGRSSTPTTRSRGKFYLWLALACAAIALGGFVPTYWLQLPAHTFAGPPLIHIHGFLCTAWILFLVSQTWLVSNGRIRNHRDWGLAGIALASAVVVLGIITAINAMQSELAHGFGDAARAFLIVPFAAILRFGLFTGAAIACVHRPDWHKRLMMVGTIGMIEAAAARIGFTIAQGYGPGMRPGFFAPAPPLVPMAVGLILQSLIIVGMIHDRRTRGAVHPAWIVGLTGSVGVILVKVPLSGTAAWLTFADWTAHIAG